MAWQLGEVLLHSVWQEASFGCSLFASGFFSGALFVVCFVDATSFVTLWVLSSVAFCCCVSVAHDPPEARPRRSGKSHLTHGQSPKYLTVK